MLTNRIEFYPCDTAALHLGATPFSIYNTSTAEQIEYLFGNAGNAVVITERQFLEQIERARAAADAAPRRAASTATPPGGDRLVELLEARGGAGLRLRGGLAGRSPARTW